MLQIHNSKKYNKAVSDLPQKLLRQVGRSGGVKRPRLGQSGDDGTSSLSQRQRLRILMIFFFKNPLIFIYNCGHHILHSPSCSSSASSDYKLKWAPLDPPNREQSTETRKTIYLWVWQYHGKVNVSPHRTLILLPDGWSTPQCVDTIHSHSKAELWLWLSTLQPQLLHYSPHHIAAALHTVDTLQQRGGKPSLIME